MVTGSPSLGAGIALVELITKTLLYYFHERVWFNVDMPESQKRHITKTITWRVVGTIDTMIIAWLLSGDPMTGLHIGWMEAIIKMVMYYAHERIWHMSRYGLEPID